MSQLTLLSPQDFFRNQVHDASRSLSLKLAEDIEFYLVNLLCEFVSPVAMKLGEENVLDKPLALMMAKAMESGPDDQIKLLKRLGDTSLYVSGYFQECFKRKAVDVSYYMEMGSVAYDKTAKLMKSYKHDNHFSQVYTALAQEFRKLVAVITEIADSLIASRRDDILSTYLKWQTTHSERLRRVLEEQGVEPVLFHSKLSS